MNDNLPNVAGFFYSLVSSVDRLNEVWNRRLNFESEILRKMAFVGLAFVATLCFPFILLGIRLGLSRSRRCFFQTRSSYDSDRSLFESIEKHDLISFDVFDTLVLRDVYRPSDIFEIIEVSRGLGGFAQTRREAENVANKKVAVLGRANANLNEIYGCMPTNLGPIRTLEFEIEKEFCISNPTMKRAFDHALQSGRKVVVASDTYLSEQEMEEILANCQYHRHDGLYVSSSDNLRKSDGSMYQAILTDFRMKPEQVLHIGDDKHSDFHTPQRFGINSFRYAKVKERNPRLFRTEDKVFGAIHNGIISNSLSEPRSYFFELGASLFGPLYLSLVNWIADQMAKDRTDALYFLSRDGYLVKKVYDYLYDDPTKYAYVSRLVIKRALLDVNGINPSKVFTSELTGHSLTDVGKKLVPQLKPEALMGTRFEGRLIGSETEEIYPDFIEFLQSKHGNYLHEQHDLLMSHLSSIGMTTRERIGVMDVGWQGTMQEGLQILMRADGFSNETTGYYIGILDNEANRERSRKNRMRGFAFLLERPRYCVELYERFFTAPHGTVIGFEAKNNEIVPLLDANPNELRNHLSFLDFESGVLWYIARMDRLRKYMRRPVSAYECMAMVERFIKTPSYSDLKNVSQLLRPDVFDGPSAATLEWPSSLISRIVYDKMRH